MAVVLVHRLLLTAEVHKNMSTIIKIRRGTSTEWTLANPVLNLAEPGLETDTLNIKFGDGVTEWELLPYTVLGGSMQSWLAFSSSYDSDIIISASINNITASLQAVDQKTDNIINVIIPGVEESTNAALAVVDGKTDTLFEAFDSQSIVLLNLTASFEAASASLSDRIVVLADASGAISARLFELDAEFGLASASLVRLDGTFADSSSAFATSLLSLSSSFLDASSSFLQQFSTLSDASSSFATSVTKLTADYNSASADITEIKITQASDSSSFAAILTDLDSNFEASSASFNGRIITLAEASSAFAGELTTFNASLNDANASITTLNAALVDSSSAFSTSLTALSSSYENASSSFIQQFSTLTNASSSFASNVSTLSVSFNTTSGSLQGRISTVEASYVTENAAITIASERITASFDPGGVGSSSLAAGVAQEAVARATADGFLEGQYTLQVAAGDIVTGMRITSATGSAVNISDITFNTNNFRVFTASETATKLLDISAGAVVFTPNIKSSNFSTGVSGWIIDKDGNAEFNTVVIRQSVLHPLASPTLSPGTSTFESTIDVTITQAAATAIRYSVDGTYPTLDGGTSISSGGTVNITNTTALIAVAYDGQGRSSGEAVGIYTKVPGISNSYSLTVTNLNAFTGQNSTIFYPENTFIVKEFIKNQCTDFNVEISSANVSVSGASSTKTDTGTTIKIELTLTENTTITVDWQSC